MLQHILFLRDGMRAAQSSTVTAVHSRIRYLISLVRLLTVSGYVSMQNAHTMVEALDELGSFLVAAQRSALSENVSISREDLLDVHNTPIAKLSPPAQRSVKDIKDNVSVKDMELIAGLNKTSVSVEHNNGQVGIRAHSIVEILRVGGSLGIKDICSNLPEYSEKMIQRELLELVAKGMVLKTGLKRWSKYSIAG